MSPFCRPIKSPDAAQVKSKQAMKSRLLCRSNGRPTPKAAQQNRQTSVQAFVHPGLHGVFPPCHARFFSPVGCVQLVLLSHARFKQSSLSSSYLLHTQRLVPSKLLSSMAPFIGQWCKSNGFVEMVRSYRVLNTGCNVIAMQSPPSTAPTRAYSP